MINYCKRADNAVVVAICDNSPEVLQRQKERDNIDGITFYGNFDAFIEHEMIKSRIQPFYGMMLRNISRI